MTSFEPSVVAAVLGPEVLVVLGVVVLLFGGSQIPKLARSLGQAQKEFKAGQEEADRRSLDSGDRTSGAAKPRNDDN